MRPASVTARRAGAIAALVAALMLSAAVGAYVVWHSPAQVDRERLLDSVRGEVGSIAPDGDCALLEPRRWRCEVPDASSGGATYRIEVKSDDRCWEGVAEEIYGQAPRTVRGCVS
jgi:hypothetical protein